MIPKRRVTGETLRERMNEDAYEYILPARYLRRNDEGQVVEDRDEMFRRVARAVAAVEDEHDGDAAAMEEAFYRMMTRLEFMPNSPTLMNAGTELPQLAACFVLSPRDDLESIFDTLKYAALIFKSGGGVGYAFSNLRPAGTVVRSTGGSASGPLSFMRIYDQTCDVVQQGGRRRGAQMGILRIDHPDIGRFAVAKRREGALANFNLSVAVTDRFIRALDEDADYELLDPRTNEPFTVNEACAQFYSSEFAGAEASRVPENLWRDVAEDIDGLEAYRDRVRPELGDAFALPARFVWMLVCDGAWRNGEPGLFMIDEANRDHSFDVERLPEHRIEATNPCGEQPLEDKEACNLGHVNLSLMVAEDAPLWFEQERSEQPRADGDLSAEVASFLERAIDWERLETTVTQGTHFLDNVVSLGEFPLDEITEKVRSLRNIGLGVMGFAHMLIGMGVVYGSDASVEIARQVMAYIQSTSKRVSRDLAIRRGTFASWESSKYADPERYPDWFARHTGLDPQEWSYGFELRNHHTTTIAPTGTTSIIANTSGGCEPLYNVFYVRHVSPDVSEEAELTRIDGYFLEVLEANGIDVDEVRGEAEEKIREGTFEGPRSLTIPEPIADLFVTAADVAPEDHVRIQAAFQEGVDSAVSKTINLPHDATREDIERVYRLAVELGCKGLTVYRAGSRESEVLAV